VLSLPTGIVSLSQSFCCGATRHDKELAEAARLWPGHC
jgi:hypothetical protein